MKSMLQLMRLRTFQRRIETQEIGHTHTRSTRQTGHCKRRPDYTRSRQVQSRTKAEACPACTGRLSAVQWTEASDPDAHPPTRAHTYPCTHPPTHTPTHPHPSTPTRTHAHPPTPTHECNHPTSRHHSRRTKQKESRECQVQGGGGGNLRREIFAVGYFAAGLFRMQS